MLRPRMLYPALFVLNQGVHHDLIQIWPWESLGEVFGSKNLLHLCAEVQQNNGAHKGLGYTWISR